MDGTSFGTLTEGIFMVMAGNFNAYFSSVHGLIMESFGLFFRGIMTLYTIFIGYMYMTNKNEGEKLLKSYFLIAMFYLFVLETDAYAHGVYLPFIRFVENITSAFLGGENASSIFKTLDAVTVKFIQKSSALWPSGSWNPVDYIFAVVGYITLYAFFFTMVFAFLVIYVISYFSMCLFLLIGGIFILLGCIDKTRSMFFAWLKNLMQFAFTIIMASISLGVVSEGILESISTLGRLDINNFLTIDFFGFLGWCALGIVLFLKSADWAAGLTGTIAGSTAGIAGGMAKAGGLTAAGTAGAGALGAQGGLAGAGYLAGKLGMSRTQAAAGSALEMLKKMRGIK